MLYKKSKYTIIEKVPDGYLLFNTLHNIRAFVYKEDYIKQIEKLISGDVIPESEIICGIKKFCADTTMDETKLALGLLNYKNTVDDVLRLIVVATSACNFCCVYCYQTHSIPLTMDDSFEKNLYNAIIDFKANHGMKKVIIEWFGGEPLLCADKIKKFTIKLNQWCVNNNVEYNYTATTNGYYLTKDLYESLSKIGFSRFTVTVDGFKDLHNRLRTNAEQADTWSVIINNLNEIKKSKESATILLRANYNYQLLSDIDSYVKFLSENFKTEKFSVFFYPIKKWGGENDSDLEVIDDSLLYVASTIILETLNKYKLRSEYYVRKLDIFSNICYAGDYRSFYINVNGDIQKCSLIPDKNNKIAVIGTINNGRLEYDEVKNILYTTPDYFSMEKFGCGNCEYLPLCYGLGCPYASIAQKELKCTKLKMDFKNILLHTYYTSLA